MEKAKKSVLPYYGVGAVWLAYAYFKGFSSFPNYLVAAVLSFGAYIVLRALFDKQIKAKEENKSEVKEDKPISTGNKELDEMLETGRKAISEMKRLDDAIADEHISEDIRKLEASSQKIFDQVKEKPEKLPDIRKFMNYYLPTTLKLLNAYDRMGQVGGDGENVTTTLDKIEGIMDTIVKAFDKQLDSLFGSEAMDISTDVTVLENMMAREGLTEDPMAAARESASN